MRANAPRGTAVDYRFDHPGVAVALPHHVCNRDRDHFTGIVDGVDRTTARRRDPHHLVAHQRRWIIDKLSRANHRQPTDLRTWVAQRNGKRGGVTISGCIQCQQQQFANRFPGVVKNGLPDCCQSRSGWLGRTGRTSDERFYSTRRTVAHLSIRLNESADQHALAVG